MEVVVSNLKSNPRCSFCKDASIFSVPNAKGKMLKFCEGCLTAVMMEAVKILGDKIREIL